jgi:hypothetical protein
MAGVSSRRARSDYVAGTESLDQDISLVDMNIPPAKIEVTNMQKDETLDCKGLMCPMPRG